MNRKELWIMHHKFRSDTWTDGQWGGITITHQNIPTDTGIVLASQSPEDLHQLADWLKSEAFRFERIRNENDRMRSIGT